MNVRALIKGGTEAVVKFGKVTLDFSKRHAPVILTLTGTGLVIAGGIRAYISGKNVEANECCREYCEEYLSIREERGVDSFELKKLAWRYNWKEYIAPYILIGSGVACIWAGFHIQNKRLAKVASALVAAEGIAAAYSDQIADMVANGTATEKKAASKVEQNVAHAVAESIDSGDIPGDGDTVFVDGLTGFVFKSTESKIREAEAQVLSRLADGDNVGVDEFFTYLGIEHPGIVAQTHGWIGEPGNKKPDIYFGANYLHDGKMECIIRYNASKLPDANDIIIDRYSKRVYFE